MSERLSLIQAEARQLLEHQREDAAAEREAMLGMCAERDEKIRECQKEMDRLKMEVKKLSNDLGHMKNQKNEWEMRCADVAKQVEHWQAECVEARRKADEDDELERMRKENKQLFDRTTPTTHCRVRGRISREHQKVLCCKKPREAWRCGFPHHNIINIITVPSFHCQSKEMPFMPGSP